MVHNWKQKIISVFSISTMLFAFQACYGTPQDIGSDILVEGTVKSKKSGQPIRGIKVSPVSGSQFKLTDQNGDFSFYVYATGELRLRFEDADSTLNGYFRTKDTTLYNPRGTVFVDIALEDR